MLIRGSDLNPEQRRQVLAAYIYRWTLENTRRAEAWRGIEGAPTIPLQTDQEWLAEHAFHFTRDGRCMMANRHRAEPVYMADEPTITQAVRIR